MEDEVMEARRQEAARIANEEMLNAIDLKMALAMRLAMRRSTMRKLSRITRPQGEWSFTDEELKLLLEIEKVGMLGRIALSLETLAREVRSEGLQKKP